MKTLHTIAEWRRAAEEIRAAGETVGLVPTMGALHEGHVALVRAALANGDRPLVTIFVNPRQFNNSADLAAYPSTLDEDLALLEGLDVAVVVAPTANEMWPDGDATKSTVHVAELGDRFEGAGRPGHFDGVASVVTKLFSITGPCRAYFGEKDFQQVTIVEQLVRDLDLAVTVVRVPTVRDTSGVALSSRNRRLSTQGHDAAAAMGKTLHTLEKGQWTLVDVNDKLRTGLATLTMHYAAVVDSVTLGEVDAAFSGTARVLLCSDVEGVRLLDNGPVELKATACS